MRTLSMIITNHKDDPVLESRVLPPSDTIDDWRVEVRFGQLSLYLNEEMLDQLALDYEALRYELDERKAEAFREGQFEARMEESGSEGMVNGNE